MVHRVVSADGLDVRSDLTIFKLPSLSTRPKRTHIKRLTWRTVTGYRAPWLSHIAVIPRLRAIIPVLIEFGVHLATISGFEVLAAALMTPEWMDRHETDGFRGRSASVRQKHIGWAWESSVLCVTT
jgi:hypothetical protein